MITCNYIKYIRSERKKLKKKIYFIKKKIMTLVSVVLMAMMICGTQVFAVRETIVVIPNQAWNQRPSISRSGSHYYGTASCYAVYPLDNSTDYFSRVRVRITNGYQTNSPISDVYYLSETGGEVKVYIKDGYAALRSISFGFSGNSDKAAYADVYYTGN